MLFSLYPNLSRGVHKVRSFLGIKPIERFVSFSIVSNFALARHIATSEQEGLASNHSDSSSSDYERRNYASDDYEFMDANYFGRPSSNYLQGLESQRSARIDHPITQKGIIGG